MNQAKEIVSLFQHADQMMEDYILMVKVFREHIHKYLEQDTPLPEGVRVALIAPDKISFLREANDDLQDDLQVLQTHLSAARLKLSNPTKIRELLDAENVIMSWPNSISRSMETVLNENYIESDILPPPFMYWQPIDKKYREIFIYMSSDPRYDQQLTSVLNYLRTVENPWAKYATKSE